MRRLPAAGALAALALGTAGLAFAAPALPRRDAPASAEVTAPALGSRAAGAAETDGADRSFTPGFYAPPPELFAPPQARECVGDAPERFYEFTFTRGVYTEGGGRYGGRDSWRTDYPKADCQFITVVERLAGLDMFDDSNALNLDDPQLRRFPFLYMLEVGHGMSLTEAETEGLRGYVEAGGTLIIDDFWGTREWSAFEREFRRIFPDYQLRPVPMDHVLFRIFYTIDEIVQVPNIGNAERISLGYGNDTSENDGYVPQVLGVEDADGRLMIIVNFNTDLGDAWEHAENPYYPLHFSTYAFEMGVNMILYSMTH